MLSPPWRWWCDLTSDFPLRPLPFGVKIIFFRLCHTYLAGILRTYYAAQSSCVWLWWHRQKTCRRAEKVILKRSGSHPHLRDFLWRCGCELGHFQKDRCNDRTMTEDAELISKWVASPPTYVHWYMTSSQNQHQVHILIFRKLWQPLLYPLYHHRFCSCSYVDTSSTHQHAACPGDI